MKKSNEQTAQELVDEVSIELENKYEFESDEVSIP